MSKVIRYLVALFAGGFLFAAAGTAQAVQDSGTQTVTATVSSAATLTLGVSTVTFASANPSSSPSITETESGAQLDVTADARTSAAGAVTLMVIADGALTSGSDTIPIANLTWAGTGTGYDATGTMDATTAQEVGAWTGPGVHTGTVTYSFANSWNYVNGTYSAVLTYTLTSP